MTIKAKRAKALPILSENVDYAMGGMVDQTLPPRAEAFLATIADSFDDDLGEWFRCQIGIYRILYDHKENAPAINEEMRLIREAEKVLREAMKRLVNLPPTADAYINAAAWKSHGKLFHSGLLNDFLALGDQIQLLLGATDQQLDALPKTTGRKSQTDRDKLLSDTAEKLRNTSREPLKARKAAALASELLRASGVYLPDSVIEVERLIRSYSKGGKTDSN